MTVRIGNGAGFLGDQLDAPRLLVESSELDYLTLEYLAELTMSILARQRQKDPAAGYARDFLEVIESLCPPLHAQSRLRIVTNAGGVNPHACAQAVSAILQSSNLADQSIGVVSGDDLLDRLDELQNEGCEFRNLETGEPLSQLSQPVVNANAYLGAAPIADALTAGARIVISGRVADASLTLGPAMHEFGWAWDDWNQLAGASVAGHLIECGAQVTGGYSTSWQQHELANVGYPIAELTDIAGVTITKAPQSGGRVDRQTVVEQLVYEIGDPRHYLTPDVDVDFTTVEVEMESVDRVQVRRATGGPPPDSYKVSLSYQNGFTANSTLVVAGSDAESKARQCAEIVFERLARAGVQLARSHVELLGCGDGVDRFVAKLDDESKSPGTREVVLRIAVQDDRREAVELFTKTVAPLITSGPAGLAGYATGRSAVRPVYAYWPTLVPKECVTPSVEVRTAKDWLQSVS